MPTPIEKLKLAIPQRAQTALLRSLSMLLAGPIVYSIFLRKHAWSWALWFAKIFWSLPRSASTPPTIPPFHISLLVRSVASSFFLVFLWEASDATFSAFATQEPLKRGRPLTDDSRDPNGSLLIGLRSKKEIPKSFAFWELHYISQHLPDRRKSIFEDIDRKGGATWVQVLSLCLDVVAGLNARIEAAINPPPPAPARPAQMVEQGNPQPLPRLTAPLQEGDIFTPSPPPASRPEMVKSTVSTIAKSYGQSPSSPSLIPRISPRVKRVIEYGVDKTLTPEQKQMLTKEGRASTVSGYLREFLKSVAGRPLRQTLRRRSAAVALGTPYGGMSILIDAVDSLSRLAVLSLSEDPYGKVQADVPVIIRTYVNTAKNLDTLKGALEPHWTDVEGDSDGYRERSFAEVDTVQTAVRGGLAKVLEAFGPYATVMGLGKGEMRLAREAAGLAEERDGEVGRRR
ncbi:MAG: hypothetical protein M1832_000086 [Thelocarpon impressellum]|nr:MAG: hypothetical protein M1832_000086 [Thelocarpon impressellum]